MLDQLFGSLDLDDCGYWNSHLKLDWFGEEQEVGLMIDSCYESQTEVSDRQRETCRAFLEKWPKPARGCGQGDHPLLQRGGALCLWPG